MHPWASGSLWAASTTWSDAALAHGWSVELDGVGVGGAWTGRGRRSWASCWGIWKLEIVFEFIYGIIDTGTDNNNSSHIQTGVKDLGNINTFTKIIWWKKSSEMVNCLNQTKNRFRFKRSTIRWWSSAWRMWRHAAMMVTTNIQKTTAAARSCGPLRIHRL